VKESLSSNLRLVEHSSYSTLRIDAINCNGFSTHRKCTSALRMLTYDNIADSIGEYIKMEKKFHLRVPQNIVEVLLHVSVRIIVFVSRLMISYDC
jgi:hypothetical protein